MKYEVFLKEEPTVLGPLYSVILSNELGEQEVHTTYHRDIADGVAKLYAKHYGV